MTCHVDLVRVKLGNFQQLRLAACGRDWCLHLREAKAAAEEAKAAKRKAEAAEKNAAKVPRKSTHGAAQQVTVPELVFQVSTTEPTGAAAAAPRRPG